MSCLFWGKIKKEKLINVVKSEIQNKTVTKSTFCREYLDNTEDKDNKTETMSIRANAMFSLSFLISKFNKKVDSKIMPKPEY